MAEKIQDQIRNCMRFRMAHDMWFARMIYNTRNGKEFTDIEPKIENFTDKSLFKNIKEN